MQSIGHDENEDENNDDNEDEDDVDKNIEMTFWCSQVPQPSAKEDDLSKKSGGLLNAN